jgi:hypothetical protein
MINLRKKECHRDTATEPKVVTRSFKLNLEFLSVKLCVLRGKIFGALGGA